jgi:hypothetical protein
MNNISVLTVNSHFTDNCTYSSIETSVVIVPEGREIEFFERLEKKLEVTLKINETYDNIINKINETFSNCRKNNKKTNHKKAIFDAFKHDKDIQAFLQDILEKDGEELTKWDTIYCYVYLMDKVREQKRCQEKEEMIKDVIKYMKIGHLQKIFTSDIDENNVMTY